MKIIFKIILQYYLKYLTKFILFIYKPTIIAIAGSANKTFVRYEITRILNKNGIKTRTNNKSFNTEIGLPLAVLNLQSGYNSYKKWLSVIVKALFNIFSSNYPRVLVLELGISNPGDMKYLLSIIKPDISIITDITQRYLESFNDMDIMAGEYELLIKKTKLSGLIILNNDNARINKLLIPNLKNIITFGFKDGSDWRITNAVKTEYKQLININFSDHNLKVTKQYILERFGQHHVYSLTIGLIINHYLNENNKAQLLPKKIH
ncbi:hypothetical protein CO115_02880 [Candidatus Falkowbacteria bacterium CG_4_9_14_3_um_filter_36_9]|uniref:Mur ligase central domain-containing protein n=1 Tax=Candidatus Falkowbacteria bacterium CG02_land_8_20_14_3_00_36_14 TaxID=1974560 RepID=A0A2M7DPP8_9BACT|nr:MAG: hypothetical protein COS18_02240 [Candidatus Falkowbacteria bacterium CG02_land_8_20_14_3_00_36_14]PIX12139.1 MAG: hypothetical protein COZ73_00880 [Candidatus Falkowbacteria bacterium CG_4_8_14_3_um_filter_36_11]PJA10192.1 MAG: hypothetical protein COX67_05265 [Candidatus Falkowbacteria bacterium CG_4_10_14_0_2_um_filter_36_22]PJB19365.1 MAG: hypothetical protein CO115_02880 [Candidatus Falkowbacteria bacterium CG_4_9_14_3_um_filter_36_9]